MTDTELRLACDTIFYGHRQATPAETFAAMAQWCQTHHIAHDIYGEGALVQDFEEKLAALLDFEAGLFCITGTLAQATALRLACIERGSPLVAMHPSAHIIKHERDNYQLLEHFKALQIGDPMRPWTVDDIKNLPDRLAAALYELPMREIGGQMPSWEQLEAIKIHCRDQGIHLHMDGARLWEAAAGMQRPLREITDGFDSAYVSLYKGMGGLGGAMLLGKRAFVAKAREWIARQGGNLVHRSPYVVAAAMQFEQRLAAMPDYFRRTQWLYQVLAEFPQLAPNPAQPQCNMLHLYLPVKRERAIEIRNKIAAEHRIWLFSRASHAALPGQCMIEWVVGDNLQNLPDKRVRQILALLVQEIAGEYRQ